MGLHMLEVYIHPHTHKYIDLFQTFVYICVYINRYIDIYIYVYNMITLHILCVFPNFSEAVSSDLHPGYFHSFHQKTLFPR